MLSTERRIQILIKLASSGRSSTVDSAGRPRSNTPLSAPRDATRHQFLKDPRAVPPAKRSMARPAVSGVNPSHLPVPRVQASTTGSAPGTLAAEVMARRAAKTQKQIAKIPVVKLKPPVSVTSR